MTDIIEAFLDSFDSNAQVTWALAGSSTAIASFTVGGSRVATIFNRMSDEWRASVEVAAGQDCAAHIAASVRILSGIFQCVREFLEVRQPMRFVIPDKEETLGWLFETYLKRQDTALAKLRYQMVSSPGITHSEDLSIRKMLPSSWRD